jgi:hypothetical protein
LHLLGTHMHVMHALTLAAATTLERRQQYQ